MTLQERLDLYQNMVLSCHNIYCNTYSNNLHLIFSNCPTKELYNALFTAENQTANLLSYLNQQTRPVILTSELGLVWIALPYHINEKLENIYVLGPFFADDAAVSLLEQRLIALHLSTVMHQEALRSLRTLPIISINRIFEYAIMLHYCVCEEQISLSELSFLDQPVDVSNAKETEELSTFHGTYETEQEMLRMVREGCLNYKEHMSKMAMTGHIGKLSNKNQDRQMKNAVLAGITLFSRAAIEGGLPSETSLTLADHYFQSVEACHSMAELMEISYAMQDDFIQRVHRCHQQNGVSKSIQRCCDYIELHVEEPLNLKLLADMSGYAPYYLSKKFKKETGQTPKDYIRYKRIERAKFLLSNTKDSVLEIGERLQYCSQSYFSESFGRLCGMSPLQYREKYGRR